jgi:hypothetical protein
MNPNDPAEMPSRRRAIQAGAGLVAAPAVLAAGGPASGHTAGGQLKPEPLRDPRELYPKPPFKKQQQEPPGLASKMEPRPDHGEKSYRGGPGGCSAVRR